MKEDKKIGNTFIRPSYAIHFPQPLICIYVQHSNGSTNGLWWQLNVSLE